MTAPGRYLGVPGFNVGQESVVATPSSIPNPLQSLRENIELVDDLCRYAEGVLTESAVRKKWRLGEDVWEALGNDDELVRAVEEAKIRRVRSGATKRERAQQHIIRGPDVLATIMDDPKANARHRVDSIKTLNAIADPGLEAAAEQERIFIRIDLSADTRAKGQEPNPGDILELEVTPKPKPIDSWDAPKQLENAPPRRKDGGDGDNF
jgi:hypothetical protein